MDGQTMPTTDTTTVLRQDALNVVSDDPEMAAEVDRRWEDDRSATIGARLRLMTDLCVQVLREHGFKVSAESSRGGES